MYANATMRSLSTDYSLYPAGTGSRRSTQPPPASRGYAQTSVDDFTFSAEAMQKSTLATILNMVSGSREDANSGIKTLAQVGQDLQEDLAAFDDLISGIFSAADIDTSQPLTLQADGRGHVLVQSEHKDARAVNDLFAENSVMVSRFMVIAARSSILDAAETEPGFKADYEKDARQAIRTHIDALKERMLGFRMRIGEE